MALPCIVAVPARLESSRLPGKVMADIGGNPMLQRVLERCGQAASSAAVLLCTDSPDLAASAAHGGSTPSSPARPVNPAVNASPPWPISSWCAVAAASPTAP